MMGVLLLQHPHMVVAGSVIVATSPHGGGRECYCCNIPTWWWLVCVTGVLMLQHPHMVVAGLYDGSVLLQHPHVEVAGLYDGSVIVAAPPHGGGWPV